jgi:hypothetical protein
MQKPGREDLRRRHFAIHYCETAVADRVRSHDDESVRCHELREIHVANARAAAAVREHDQPPLAIPGHRQASAQDISAARVPVAVSVRRLGVEQFHQHGAVQPAYRH